MVTVTIFLRRAWMVNEVFNLNALMERQTIDYDYE